MIKEWLNFKNWEKWGERCEYSNVVALEFQESCITCRCNLVLMKKGHLPWGRVDEVKMGLSTDSAWGFEYICLTQFCIFLQFYQNYNYFLDVEVLYCSQNFYRLFTYPQIYLIADFWSSLFRDSFIWLYANPIISYSYINMYNFSILIKTD